MAKEMREQEKTSEGIKRAEYQPKVLRCETRKEGLKSYADVTIYAIDPVLDWFEIVSPQSSYNSGLANTQQHLMHHSPLSG